MADDLDPVLQSRLLCTRLRRERARLGFTQKHVADVLEWSPAKVLRIENGLVPVTTIDLQALLAVYGVTDGPTLERLAGFARGARGRPWSDGYEDVLTPEFVRYAGFESGASAVKQVESHLVPGALQTPRYARTVIAALSATDDPDEVVDRRVEARLRRQDVLFAGRRPAMDFILDESVLRKPVGGVEVMTEQLEHLKIKSREPDIRIQVLPDSLGATRGMRGPFVLLEFDEADIDPLLFLETSSVDLLMHDDEEEIKLQFAIFLELERIASPPEAFEQIADRVADQLKTSTPLWAAPEGP